jgi:hypothetical protein
MFLRPRTPTLYSTTLWHPKFQMPFNVAGCPLSTPNSQFIYVYVFYKVLGTECMYTAGSGFC